MTLIAATLLALGVILAAVTHTHTHPHPGRHQANQTASYRRAITHTRHYQANHAKPPQHHNRHTPRHALGAPA